MRKHRKLLIALACLVVIAGAIAFATRDNEPHYQGKSLSEWLALGYGNIPQDNEAELAVRAIGTNAIPHLLKWMRYETRAWQKAAFLRLPPSLPKTRLGRYVLGRSSVDKAESSLLAFSFLGSNAVPAVPELASLAKDTAHSITARRATTALGYIGRPALPHLLSALQDTNSPNRSQILKRLALLYSGPPDADPVIAPLQAGLTDHDLWVRDVATNALLQIAPELLTNAPAK